MCFNFLEMLNFTSSSFFYFCFVRLFFCGGGRDSLKVELKDLYVSILAVTLSPPPPPPPKTHTHTHTRTHTHTLLQLRLRPVSSHNLGWPLKPKHYEILKSQHRSRYFHLHVHLLVHCWYEVETILSSANVQSVERCSEKTWGEFTLQSLSLSLPHFSTNSTCKKIVFVNSNQ